MRHAILAAALVIAAGSASAQPASVPVSDPATGLGVTPPAGYTARLGPAGNNQTSRIALRREGDAPDTGCQVGFADRQAQPGMTQAELNKAAESVDMDQIARQAIGAIYDVQETAPFEHAGIRGLQIVADIKKLPNLPPRAQEIRSMLIMLDTPKGRTSVVCVGEKGQFAQRLPEFQSVARGVTAPG